LDGNSDLFREAFLDLQTTTERLRNTCELGQAKDKFIRNIRYGDFTGKGNEVVLAKAGNIDVTDDNHLFVVFRKNGIIDDI